MTSGYIFSIVLNVVLAIIVFFALFFQDFINTYILHRVKRGEDDKKEGREVLKKLRVALLDYSGSAQLCIMNTLTYFKGNSLVKSDSDYLTSKARYDQCERTLSELTPDLKEDMRNRLTAIRLPIQKLLIYASGGQQFVTNMKKELTSDEFAMMMTKTYTDIAQFITDIEKIINV